MGAAGEASQGAQHGREFETLVRFGDRADLRERDGVPRLRPRVAAHPVEGGRKGPEDDGQVRGCD